MKTNYSQYGQNITIVYNSHYTKDRHHFKKHFFRFEEFQNGYFDPKNVQNI